MKPYHLRVAEPYRPQANPQEPHARGELCHVGAVQTIDAVGAKDPALLQIATTLRLGKSETGGGREIERGKEGGEGME